MAFFFTAYVQSKHKVSRSILIDCANDKCANFRRGKKQQI